MLSLEPVTRVKSSVLGCDVLFVMDTGTPISRDLAGMPVYVWAELLELLRIGLTPDELPAIHKAKMVFGGTIGDVPVPAVIKASDCPSCGSADWRAGKCGWCGHQDLQQAAGPS